MFGRFLRQAARSVSRRPHGSWAALLSFSLGIGTSTVVFSVIKGVLLMPLPYPESERLVLLRARNVRSGETRPFVSFPDFRDWQRQARSFEAMALYQWSQLDLRNERDTERVRGIGVTPEYFRLLGLTAAIGRLPDEDSIDRELEAIVLSRDLWKRRFGADPTLVGRTIPVNSWRSLPSVGPTRFRVLAVTDEPSRFLPMSSGLDRKFVGVDDGIDFWLPLRRDEEALTERHFRDSYGCVARLRPGVTRDQAEAELEAISRELAEEYPDSNTDWGITVVPLSEAVTGAIQPALWLLTAGVGLLLLLSCSNVVSAQLVRTLGRRRELALRRALGASMFQLRGELLAETLAFAMIGGGLGVASSAAGVRLIKILAPPQLPRIDAIQLDAGVLLFALGLSAAAGLVTGWLPSRLLLRAPFLEALESSGRRAGTSRESRYSLEALASSTIGMALVLLIAAALLHQTLTRLLEVDAGYDPKNVLTLNVSLPEAKYEWRRNSDFLHELEQRLSSLPGVVAVGAVRGLPGRETHIEAPLRPSGGAIEASEDSIRAQIRVVSPSYFEAMGISLLGGRGFEPKDQIGAIGFTRVVLVNQALATRFWPGENAIGKKLGIRVAELPEMTVVGVVEDVRYGHLESPPGPEVYYPEALFPQPSTDLVLRTRPPPAALAGPVLAAIRALEPEALVSDVRSMEEVVDRTIADRRFAASLLNGLSLVALVLAVLGVAAVMARNVDLRRRELGVRLALGARAEQVVGLVLCQSLVVTGLGLVMGLLGAAATRKLLSSLLYDIEPTDAVTHLAACLAISAATTLAALFPATSAARTDPLRVLRQD